MERYPNISDHGLGDLQTAAPVTTGGTVEVTSCERFDSPAMFASLADAGHGGYFESKPATTNYVIRQLSLANTAMLITRFLARGGVQPGNSMKAFTRLSLINAAITLSKRLYQRERLRELHCPDADLDSDVRASD